MQKTSKKLELNLRNPSRNSLRQDWHQIMTLFGLNHSVIFGIKNKYLIIRNRPPPLHISSVVLSIWVIIFSCSFSCFGFVILLCLHCTWSLKAHIKKKKKKAGGVGGGGGITLIIWRFISIERVEVDVLDHTYLSFFLQKFIFAGHHSMLSKKSEANLEIINCDDTCQYQRM